MPKTEVPESGGNLRQRHSPTESGSVEDGSRGPMSPSSFPSTPDKNRNMSQFSPEGMQSKSKSRESLKAQKKTYRSKKKEAAKELMSSITDPSVVLLGDWLKVRGTLKSWTKLWCVLKPGILILYKSDKHKGSQWVGTILLNTCQLLERPSKKDGFCYKLFHPLDQSIWATRGPKGETIGAFVQPLPYSYCIFRAPSESAGKCWMDALELALKCTNLLKRSMTRLDTSASDNLLPSQENDYHVDAFGNGETHDGEGDSISPHYPSMRAQESKMNESDLEQHFANQGLEEDPRRHSQFGAGIQGRPPPEGILSRHLRPSLFLGQPLARHSSVDIVSDSGKGIREPGSDKKRKHVGDTSGDRDQSPRNKDEDLRKMRLSSKPHSAENLRTRSTSPSTLVESQSQQNSVKGSTGPESTSRSPHHSDCSPVQDVRRNTIDRGVGSYMALVPLTSQQQGPLSTSSEAEPAHRKNMTDHGTGSSTVLGSLTSLRQLFSRHLDKADSDPKLLMRRNTVDRGVGSNLALVPQPSQLDDSEKAAVSRVDMDRSPRHSPCRCGASSPCSSFHIGRPDRVAYDLSDAGSQDKRRSSSAVSTEKIGARRYPRQCDMCPACGRKKPWRSEDIAGHMPTKEIPTIHVDPTQFSIATDEVGPVLTHEDGVLQDRFISSPSPARGYIKNPTVTEDRNPPNYIRRKNYTKHVYSQDHSLRPHDQCTLGLQKSSSEMEQMSGLAKRSTETEGISRLARLSTERMSGLVSSSAEMECTSGSARPSTQMEHMSGQEDKGKHEEYYGVHLTTDPFTKGRRGTLWKAINEALHGADAADASSNSWRKPTVDELYYALLALKIKNVRTETSKFELEIEKLRTEMGLKRPSSSN